MFDKVNEQFQKSLKPVTELVSVNAKAMESLVQQQNALFSSLLNQGVAFVDGATEKKDLKSLVEAQKSYAEGVQDQVAAAAKDAYDVITSAQEKAGEVLKTAMEEAQAAVNSAAKAAK